ncbi:hypothetical protein [Polyangium aurulentum]|uniref:hypothetical protein n=1 Tax=Polyangium aurulentum TaxID=2567896 RepID=UPI0010ADBF5F|nr:hypothetical protein [Polyangium aurulentum]UQA62797.1 hypothetical protein E8A73_021035 [Polyangium aurulentum]
MLPRLLVGASLLTTALALSFAVPACWYSDGYAGGDCPPGTSDECCPCPIPEACPDGSPPIPPHCTDGGTDGGTDGEQSALCPSGACVPSNPEGWEGPVDLWSGIAFEVPPCPDGASTIVFEGQPEPEPPPCASCFCDPPLGSCKLPETWTVSAASCLGGGVKTNFDPPPGWDGSCTANTSIQSGKLCGGVPCVQSISVSPPILEEQPCQPHGSEPPPEPAKLLASGPFAPFARACSSAEPLPACAEGESVCLASSPGFAACVHHAGDEQCPEGWPVKHLLYGHVDDQRTCSECACEAPTGGKCTAKGHVYGDTTCAAEWASLSVSSDDPSKCIDLISGVALAGKTAELLAHQPGTCAPSGGEPIGALLLADAKTFCCLTPVT